MSCQPAAEDKEDKKLSSAEFGKVLQNPHLPRNQEEAPNKQAEDEHASLDIQASKEEKEHP